MTMVAVRLLIWSLAVGFTLLMPLGCSRHEPAEAKVREWAMVPMAGGPALYWACINGDRVYALQDLHSRATQGLWPGGSIAVAAGRCGKTD